ncbi:MAG: cystathionine gamma-synthase [Rhodothermales bacterium]|jgi:cystathionine gamma-synthase
MPTWQDNVDYEEGRARVVDKLDCGYPRFVYHKHVRDLFAHCELRSGAEKCLAFASRGAAERCATFIGDASVHEVDGVFATGFAQSAAPLAKAYWQHSGEGLSWRQAEAVLAGQPAQADLSSDEALRITVAQYMSVAPDDVFLFPTGMAAIFTAYRALSSLAPETASVQFGFPYVDTLKIQQKFGRCHFLPRGDAADLAEFAILAKNEPLMGLFCEFPANPLLVSPDLFGLKAICREQQIPLVVDDTVATLANLALLDHCDILATSLTKFFSGEGDVMGGSLVLNSTSPRYSELRSALEAVFEPQLWLDDAHVLLRNSQDFHSRMRIINRTAEQLADFLHAHPAVAEVYYPKFTTPENYARFLQPFDGGFGGLMSIVLKDATQTPVFFDALAVTKGPSLGTNFTLACPYTVLAHYEELDFARDCGVAEHLVRISVGGESDLCERFRVALDLSGESR